MSNRPLIGVSSLGKGPFRQFMELKYVNCVKRSGAKVRVLKPTTRPATLEKYLQECDGFVFTGGADIEPALYCMPREAECGEPNEARDSFEYALLKMALDRNIPVLCICRGMQMLNVVCGGTLYQDIKSFQKNTHVDIPNASGISHPLKIDKDSLLAGILHKEEIGVNSLHHQAVHQVAPELRAVGWSDDGFVEAIEFEDRDTFALGVQWHPEHMANHNKDQKKIFDAFVKACR